MEEIQKEMRVRKRLSALFNKTEPDFPNKEEYDAYLEMVEDYVYSLSNNVDVAQTEEKMKEYERANRHTIIANQARQAEAHRRAAAAAAAAAAPPSTSTSVAAAPAAAAAPVSYTPTATGPVGNIQPRPLQAAAMDAEGSLVPTHPHHASRADACRAVAAGGWDPDIARRRLLHDAFNSVFAW